jgi:hypothetical protein
MASATKELFESARKMERKDSMLRESNEPWVQQQSHRSATNADHEGLTSESKKGWLGF